MTINNNIISAALGTTVAEIITLPVCTIKTNYQNTNSNSIYNTIHQIYIRGGIRAFYNASIPAIFGQVFSTTSKYTIYRYLDSNIDYPIKNKFLNGITSGVIASLVTHPLDVIKIHIQMNESIYQHLQKDGPSILYRGYSKTLIKIATSSSIFFPIYDTLQNRINNPSLSSMMSGFIASLIMQPIDYLKTRHMAGLSLYNGYNILTYYKGLTLNMMRIIPHFVITMNIIERCKKN